jgi:hypothetical protein
MSRLWRALSSSAPAGRRRFLRDLPPLLRRQLLSPRLPALLSAETPQGDGGRVLSGASWRGSSPVDSATMAAASWLGFRGRFLLERSGRKVGCHSYGFL